MKITHINVSDTGGGASRSAYRLHDGLNRLGLDSRMFVQHKYTHDPLVQNFVMSRDPIIRIRRKMRRSILEHAMARYANTIPEDQTFFRDDRSPFQDEVYSQIPPSDVLQLHWISGFIDHESFFKWVPGKHPLAWTFHDMAAFTGGCCQDLRCGKFSQQCGACPQLGSSDQDDLTRQVWKRKNRYYSSIDPERFHIVTPSKWLQGEVNRSPLLSRFKNSVIPYGLDLEVFQPRDRRFSREVLGIPLETKVLLFVSNGLNVRLKGLHLLVDALKGIEASKDLFLLCLGPGALPELDHFPNSHIRSVTDDRVLSMIYSAADIFLLPSLADNLPNTMLESIACGTPVVAFATGGIPEAVRPDVTGLLAKAGDTQDLRSAILQLLGDNAKRARMAVNCRKIALAEYGINLHASRYLSLYQGMLGRAVE